MDMEKKNRIILSGGGTGGHIYPAISIADALRKADPECEILFVGAEGKMEMEKVPAAGYKIVGLPVAGLKRKLALSNLALPFKVLKSLRMAKRVIRDFRPDVVVGVGGYASAPVLKKAQTLGIPTVVQEQNSYAGLTNKIVSKKAKKICVAYEGMEKFFPAENIILTGNPIRTDIHPYGEREKAGGMEYFHLDSSLPTVLIVGGSGGCGTLNDVMKEFCRRTSGKCPYQIIWQSGKGYASSVSQMLTSLGGTVEDGGFRRLGNVLNCDFISRMDLAFACSDLVVSRAGAGTISELCAIGKASIFVPSPNVAEDHQTHNAMALVNKNAAKMIRDTNAAGQLIPTVEKLIAAPEEICTMAENIAKLGRPHAAADIAGIILDIIKEEKK